MDLISRQAAIDVLIHHITPHDNGDGSVTIGVLSKSSIKDILNKLPSAQPEPCEDDPRADVYYLAEKIGIHQLYDLVVKLRGEPEPCEDAVSREDVINMIEKRMNQLTQVNFGTRTFQDGVYDGYARIRSDMKSLPFVRPGRKKGKWINVRHDNIAECDQCGITGRAWMNFCFDCGADMRAERRTDESD